MYEPTVIQPTITHEPEPTEPTSPHISVLADQVANRGGVVKPIVAPVVPNPSPTPTPTQSEPPVTVTTSDQVKTPAAIPLSQLQDELKRQQHIQDAKGEAIISSGSNSALEFNLVVLQFVALAVIVFGFFPALLWQVTFLQVLGVLLVGMGIFIAIWAVMTFKQKIRIRPSPNDNGFLVTGGPFAFVRHPMYVSLLLASIGLTIAFPTIPRIIALIVLILVLRAKMSYEERMLAARFSGYDKYKKHTGKIIPKFTKGQ